MTPSSRHLLYFPSSKVHFSPSETCDICVQPPRWSDESGSWRESSDVQCTATSYLCFILLLMSYWYFMIYNTFNSTVDLCDYISSGCYLCGYFNIGVYAASQAVFIPATSLLATAHCHTGALRVNRVVTESLDGSKQLPVYGFQALWVLVIYVYFSENSETNRTKWK